MEKTYQITWESIDGLPGINTHEPQPVILFEQIEKDGVLIDRAVGVFDDVRLAGGTLQKITRIEERPVGSNMTQVKIQFEMKIPYGSNT